MAVNRVDLADGTVVIDISDSTVAPESLLEGVKVYNAAGEPIVGTMQQSSGPAITLPEGYNMEMGLYTPTSDISSAVEVDLQNTYRWNDTGKESSCYLALFAVDLLKGVQAAGASLHARFGNGERTHNMVQSSGSTSTSSTTFITPGATTTFNTIKLTGTGSYPMKTGVTYLWIVIGELA